MTKKTREKTAIQKAFTNGKHLSFLLHSGIQFVDTRDAAELVYRIIHQLGYRKLPEDKPSLIIDNSLSRYDSIEAQRSADIRHYEEE